MYIKHSSDIYVIKDIFFVGNYKETLLKAVLQHIRTLLKALQCNTVGTMCKLTTVDIIQCNTVATMCTLTTVDIIKCNTVATMCTLTTVYIIHCNTIATKKILTP